MSIRIPQRLPLAVADRFVQKTPALVCDAGRLLDRRAEACELMREIVKRRLDLPAERPSMLREKQVAHDTADHGACHRCCNCARVVRHQCLLCVSKSTPTVFSTSCVPPAKWGVPRL